jgi:hypothetical protein
MSYNYEHFDMYGNTRIAVGVSLFVGYLAHYAFQGLNYYGNKKMNEHMNYLTKRMYLFGIMCALSVGIIQGSVYTAIMAWSLFQLGLPCPSY